MCSVKLLKRILVVVVGPLAVAFLLALVSGPPAYTQSRTASKPPPPPPPPTPVQVTNTPLPVTGNVSAAVAGTVQAQQHGAWNVGINGTPNVNVTNSPTVKVGNTPADPIPVSGNLSAMLAGPLQAQQSGSWNVSVLSEQTYAPYIETEIVFLADGDQAALCNFDVPAGQRLIVETVTFSATTQLGQRVRAVISISKPGGLLSSLSLASQSQETAGGLEVRTGTHPITIWVDSLPGSSSEVSLVVQRSPGTGEAVVSGAVSGHLVPLP
jgi:hypothetical protein